MLTAPQIILVRSPEIWYLIGLRSSLRSTA
jgi:hypothetical protein